MVNLRPSFPASTRRSRVVKLISRMPDSPARWLLLLRQLEHQFDVQRGDLDRLLDTVADISPARIALLQRAAGKPRTHAIIQALEI